MSVKRGIFDAGKSFKIEFDKKVFLYVTEGKVKINGKEILSSKDQLRSFGEKGIQLEFLEKSDVVVIESE